VAYHALAPLVPTVVFGIAALPVAGMAVAVALGRRDGIGLDAWLAAALRGARSPRRLVAAPDGIVDVPAWGPAPGPATRRTGRNGGRSGAGGVAGTLAPLRLPVDRIAGSGVVDTGEGRVAVTAATTVNFDLRTTGEQYALTEGMGRWLNSLTGPVQIVVSTRRVGMHAYADHVLARLDGLPHPGLVDAAAGYAGFLRELAEDRDPLDRKVLIAHRLGRHCDPAVARRHAERTARVLTGLGAATRVLDGRQVTDTLAGACDPWRHTGIGRSIPDAVITTGPAPHSVTDLALDMATDWEGEP
jgi:hypothetical protein